MDTGMTQNIKVHTNRGVNVWDWKDKKFRLVFKSALTNPTVDRIERGDQHLVRLVKMNKCKVKVETT